MKTKSKPTHTPTPCKVYATPTNYLGENVPQVRKVQGGQEIASVILSGYKVGHELSPMEWANYITLAVNNFKSLLETVEDLMVSISPNGCISYLEPHFKQAIEKAMKVLSRIREQEGK